MQTPYEAPEFKKDAFNCPICGAFTQFMWVPFTYSKRGQTEETEFHGARCERCQQWTMWRYLGQKLGPKGQLGQPVYEHGELVAPRVSTIPLSADDLPQDCVPDYTEARDVFATSSRSSAALLRLCLQKLCIHLGEPGKNINDDIGSLVKKGLDTRIQKALDIVRVTGNNAVHPGTMDLNDTPELAHKLFELVKLVVNEMITKPKEIDALYTALPKGALDGIKKRDGTRTTL
jgi:hypothetical protein